MHSGPGGRTDCKGLLHQEVRKAGFHVDADCSDRKMQKKVREAQLDQYNYILVVGSDEAAAGTVNVRTRDNMVRPCFYGVVAYVSTRADAPLFSRYTGSIDWQTSWMC